MQVVQRPSLHRDWLDSDAVEIVERLQKSGFKTFLVGGCVRDLLAGLHPKDYDIATTALPQDVKRKISNAYIIGRRFRLVLVKRQNKQFEVATFRRDPKPEEINQEFPTNDNIFGTEEEDARRRDFTINSIFYDPINDQLVDYCDGIRDVKEGVIRVIGDPDTRLREDPIRMLRAIRLAHKLSFALEPDLRKSILNNAQELTRSVLPRKREEILKILKLRDPMATLYEMHDLGLLQYLSKSLDQVFLDHSQLAEFEIYIRRFHDIVENINDPAQLFGALLLAYYRSTVEPDPHVMVPHNQILESQQLKTFFRDELGMSNLEQRLFAKALTLQSTLKNTDKIKKWGERRQIAILADEAFVLGLLFARVDYAISPADLRYWDDAYRTAQPKISEKVAERQGPGRRPRRYSGRPRARKPAQEPVD